MAFKEIEGVKYYDQEDIDGMIKKRLDRYKNKSSDDAEKIRKEALESFLEDNGLDMDKFNSLLEGSSPEHKRELSKFQKEAEKAAKQVQELMAALEGEKNSRIELLKKSAVSQAIVGKADEKQAPILTEILMSRIEIDESGDLVAGGKPVSEFIDSFLDEHSFLKAPIKVEGTPPPRNGTHENSKEEFGIPYVEMPDLSKVFGDNGD